MKFLKMNRIYFCCLMFCFSHYSVLAQDEEKPAKQSTEKSAPIVTSKTTTKKNVEKNPLTLFLGIDVGRLSELKSKDEKPGYTLKNGPLFCGKSAFSKKYAHLAYEGGLGWCYSRISGKELLSDNETIGSVTIATQAATIDLAMHYSPFSFLSGGIILSEWLGPDLSFSIDSTNPKALTFAGLELASFWELKRQNLRFKLDYLRNLTYAKKDLQILALGLEFGIPFGRERLIRKTQVLKKQTITNTKEVQVVKTTEVEVKVVKLFIDATVLQFDAQTNLPNLRSQNFVKELATAINELKAEFKNLTITSIDNDPKLANIGQTRATNLQHAIIALGAPGNQVLLAPDAAIGSGQGQPSSKFELSFTDVRDPSQFQPRFEAIKRKNYLPATCEGENCD